MASSGCAFSFAVWAGRVESLACWVDTHAWVQGGGRESPRRARYFSLLRQRKVPKRKATPSLRPLRCAKGQTCGVSVAGCAVELTALRCSFVQTSTASQFTRHGRFDAHAHPATAPPQAQPAGVGQPNSRTANIRSGHCCARPRLAGASATRCASWAERSKGPWGCLGPLAPLDAPRSAAGGVARVPQDTRAS